MRSWLMYFAVAPGGEVRPVLSWWAGAPIFSGGQRKGNAAPAMKRFVLVLSLLATPPAWSAAREVAVSQSADSVAAFDFRLAASKVLVI
jgi:hypothetical protein